MAELRVVADLTALADVAAARITLLITDAIASCGNAVVCLTGGHTARPVYECLADPARPWRAAVDWTRVHLFWGDERHVLPQHEDSNFGMAERVLLGTVPIPAEKIHRIRGEAADPRGAAREYESALRAGFAAAGRNGQTFDVLLLGLGEDAHIASIFPGSGFGNPASRVPDPKADRGDQPTRHAAGSPRVAAVWADHLHAWRITLTPAALLDARTILVLVSGQAKAAAVKAALELPPDVERWPAHWLRDADADVQWILDAPAASQLHAARLEP